MIFKQVNEVLDGRKTQTRRVVNATESGSRALFTATSRTLWAINEVRGASGKLKWQVGRTYAIVPKRGAPAIPDARIRLTAIRQEHLHNITEADARAEGVASVAEYRALWESINVAGSWEADPRVWVLSFVCEKQAEVA
jgi:hypothetical protein